MASFIHLHAPHATPGATDPVLVFRADHLLVRVGDAGDVALPDASHLPQPLLKLDGSARMHVGLLAERPCWLESAGDPEAPAPTGCEWRTLRSLLAVFPPEAVQAAYCARQLDWWRRRHRFCGCCGAPTVVSESERAMVCPKCGAVFYPSASPAVIVAVTRGDRLLLAHNKNFRPHMFSLLAGFVDPGETLEQAVAREVREEVGIEVEGIRYVGSQPWPFPNSLMAGFRATHRSGEIEVDGHEIEEAGWYARDAMPEIPGPGTVAHQLIAGWLRE